MQFYVSKPYKIESIKIVILFTLIFDFDFVYL